MPLSSPAPPPVPQASTPSGTFLERMPYTTRSPPHGRAAQQASTPSPRLRRAVQIGSRSPPDLADGAIDLTDLAQGIVLAPDAQGRRDEVGAKLREPGGLLGIGDVPGDARNDEDLRPPGDKVSKLIDCTDGAFTPW